MTHRFVPDESGLYCDVCDLVAGHPRHGADETVQEAHARRTDPGTSHAAAASVRNMTALQLLILRTLREIGPCTDERLAEYLQEHDMTTLSLSGLRTRRAELVQLGAVRDTGQTQLTLAGRSAIVWEISS